MRKLVLYIRKTSWHPGWEPYLLVTTKSDGEETESLVGLEGQFDNRTRLSINGILFLILDTYLDRKSSQKKGEEIRVKSLSPKYFSFLSTLFNSKQQKMRKWQEDIFKENPYHPPEQFLERKGSPQTNTTEVYILRDVELDVKPWKKEETFNDLDLRALAESLAAGEISNPRKIQASIKASNFEIRSSYLHGSLSRNDRVQVKIDWNFRCHLFVYWINSENKVIALHPKGDPMNGKEKLTENDKGERTLLIPGSKQVQVSTPPGHETCLILSAKSSLTNDQHEQLLTQIEKAVTEREGDILLEKPDFPEFPIPKKKKFLRRRLTPVQNPEGWENTIVNMLGAPFEHVCFFHIPNKP